MNTEQNIGKSNDEKETLSIRKKEQVFRIFLDIVKQGDFGFVRVL